MDAKDWKKISKENSRAGRLIGPIPYTPHDGYGEFLDGKILDEELKGLIDENGNLRFHRVHE